ncbi:DUF2061 domain-containing protein [Flavobacteriaceae bacterium]|nr:DUF2061 domain-containing protein [Flavobacteriaceae bacterium]
MLIDHLFFNQKSASSETNLRSIVKAFTWRILGSLDTIIISYFVVGDLSLAFSIGSIELVTKMFLYFFHERIWNALKWGKKNKYEY